MNGTISPAVTGPRTLRFPIPSDAKTKIKTTNKYKTEWIKSTTAGLSHYLKQHSHL